MTNPLIALAEAQRALSLAADRIHSHEGCSSAWRDATNASDRARDLLVIKFWCAMMNTHCIHTITILVRHFRLNWIILKGSVLISIDDANDAIFNKILL
jgi:hypothetical protein